MKIYRKIIRKIITFTILISLINSFVFIDMAITLYADDKADYMTFFDDSTKLVKKYWRDDFVSNITYNVGETNVYIDGKKVRYSSKKSHAAVLINDEIYVPVSTLIDVIGGDISASADKQSITMKYNGVIAEYTVNQKKSIINGSEKISKRKMLKRSGKFMLPVEEIADTLGCQVKINNDENSASFTKPYQTMRLIVKMKDNAKFSFKKYNAIDYVKSPDGIYILQYKTIEDTMDAYEKISNSKNISYITEDRFIAGINPENKNNVDLITKPDESLSWGVSVLKTESLAQSIINSGMTNSITVAVVDTGVDYTHPHLAGRAVGYGYDFINNDADAYDDNGHGTHVSGTIVDITSNLNVYILPIKVLNASGSGTSLTVANGIRYAASQGASVINLSLGGQSYGTGHYEDEAISSAIQAGCVVVAAAGNESSDTAYVCPAHNNNCIVVAAVDNTLNRADFSNYGTSVDVTAPGVDILSSVPNRAYAYYSGTSMAAPHISGVAAMLRLMYPSYSVSQIEQLIKNNTIDLGDNGFDVYYGYGIPDLSNIDILPDDEPKIPTLTPSEPTESPWWPTESPSEPTESPWWPTESPWWPTESPSEPTESPWWPTESPSEPTETPWWPTESPSEPIETPWWPTLTPIPTYTPTGIPVYTPPAPPSVPVVPTQNPISIQPIGLSVSTSSSSADGKGSASIIVTASGDVAKVTITFTDGTVYDLRPVSGKISWRIDLSGTSGSYSASIKAYNSAGMVAGTASVAFSW